jgi:hypothetical protein
MTSAPTTSPGRALADGRQRLSPSAAEAALRPPPPSSASYSLDTPETTSHHAVIIAQSARPPLPLTADQSFFHSGWAPLRRRVYDALQRTDQSERRVRAFDMCMSSVTVQEHIDAPGSYRVKGSACHDRLCQVCASQRAYQIRTALAGRVAGKAHSFLTLTVCSTTETLQSLTDELYEAFAALRRHPIWTKSVKGGAAFLEIKWNPEKNRWHPHLHCILDATYMEQGWLTEAWKSITRNSFIVDIRRIRHDGAQLSYVTKYASKPLNMTFARDNARLDEVVTTIKGRRLVMLFGDWYGTPLHEDCDDEDSQRSLDPLLWQSVGHISTILADANRGDFRAISILANCPRLQRISDIRGPAPPSDI